MMEFPDGKSRAKGKAANSRIYATGIFKDNVTVSVAMNEKRHWGKVKKDMQKHDGLFELLETVLSRKLLTGGGPKVAELLLLKQALRLMFIIGTDNLKAGCLVAMFIFFMGAVPVVSIHTR